MKYMITGSIFFIVLVVSFYLTIIQTADYKSKYPYKMKLYYSRIDGIKQGTDVYVNGVLYGMVDDINTIPANEVPDPRYLDKEEEKAIELTLVVEKPITLWDNYNIRFRNQTSFSGRSIEINPGGFDPLEPGVYNQKDIDAMTKKMESPPSVGYFEDFFSGTNKLMRENQQDIRKTVVNLRSVSDKMNHGTGDLSMIINNDSMYCAINETMNDIGIIAKEARWYAEGIKHVDNNLNPFTLTSIVNIFNLNLFLQ